MSIIGSVGLYRGMRIVRIPIEVVCLWQHVGGGLHHTYVHTSIRTYIYIYDVICIYICTCDHRVVRGYTCRHAHRVVRECILALPVIRFYHRSHFGGNHCVLASPFSQLSVFLVVQLQYVATFVHHGKFSNEVRTNTMRDHQDDPRVMVR